MPTTVQIQAGQCEVTVFTAPHPETKQPHEIRVLIITDPETRVTYHFPMPEAYADEVGAALQGKQAPDIVVASPGDIPAPPRGGNGARR